MGRTRLFRQAGSPLIQGQSRMLRPFWSEWLQGVIVAVLLAGVWAAGGSVLDGRISLETLTDGLVGAGIGAQVALVLSAVGVWVAGKMGWHRRWIAGAVLASAGAVSYLVWMR